MDDLDDPQRAMLFDFLVQLEEDRRAGRRIPLAEYQARFAPIADAIERELDGHGQAPRTLPVSCGAPQRIGRYRLVEEVGRGGQGVVWRAHDEHLDREVAVKLLGGPVWSSTHSLLRLQREAETLARLHHPAICPVFDLCLEGETPFITMAFIDGQSLAQRLAAGVRPADSRADLHRIAAFVETAARALHAAHEQGVVHRDVKPANILFDRSGDPVLLDFGLAQDTDTEKLTAPGDAVGTLAYMAPERFDAEATADRRIDVWGLGVILYEWLAGQRPFDAPSTHSLLDAICREEAADVRRWNPRVPADLAAIVHTALEKRPDKRYPNAVALADDLRRFRRCEPVRARPVTAWRRIKSWARRNPAVASSTVVAATAVLLALVSTTVTLARVAVERDRLHAQVLAGAALASADVDAQRSLVMAVQAAELEGKARSVHSDRALRAAIDHWRTELCLRGDVVACDRTGSFALTPQGDGSITLFAGTRDPAPRHIPRAKPGKGQVPVPLAFSPDGDLLAIACGAEIRLWAIDRWQWSRSLPWGKEPVWRSAFAPDGKSFGATTMDGMATLWNIDSGAELWHHRLPGHTTRFAFSPSGELILAFGSPNTHSSAGADVAVLDARSGTAIATSEFDDAVCGAGFVDDRSFVAYTRHTATLHWLDSDRPPVALGPSTDVWGIAIDRDSRRIVTLGSPSPGADDAVRGFDGESGAPLFAFGDFGRRSAHCAAFSSDGRTLAVTAFDRSVRLFDVASGRQTQDLGRTTELPGKVTWSHDGADVIVDTRFRVSIRRARPVPHWRPIDATGVRLAKFDRTGRRVLTVTRRGAAVWTTAGEAVGPVHLRDSSKVTAAAFTPDGRLVVGATDGGLRAWNAVSGESVAQLDTGGAARAVVPHPADPELVLVHGETFPLSVWNLRSGEFHTLWNDSAQPVLCAAWSPDGTRIAAGTAHRLTLVFRTENAALVARHRATGRPGHDRVWSVVFDRVGRLWSAGEAETVCWDGTRTHKVRTGGTARLIVPSPRRDEVLIAKAFLGDFGIARGSDWTLGPLRTAAHTNLIAAAEFNREGDHILTASWDGTVRLWNDDLAPVAELAIPDSRILDATFSPDGSQILTVDSAGQARLWPVDPLPLAKSLLRRLDPALVETLHR